MNDVTISTIFTLALRRGATWIAGIILAHGWANGYTSEQIVSAIVLAAEIGYSIWHQNGQAAAHAMLKGQVDYWRTKARASQMQSQPPAPSVQVKP
jgi:hypothetical protein